MIAVTNVTLKGAVLYLIVVYACIAMVLGVYSYSAVKEKIGETPSFVKRFAFIVGVQTVLFLTTSYLYDYVAEMIMLPRVCTQVQHITRLFMTVVELE